MLKFEIAEDGKASLHIEGDSETVLTEISVGITVLLDSLENGLVQAGFSPNDARLTRKEMLDVYSMGKANKEGIC